MSRVRFINNLVGILTLVTVPSKFLEPVCKSLRIFLQLIFILSSNSFDVKFNVLLKDMCF